jgi:hypothetical protein
MQKLVPFYYQDIICQTVGLRKENAELLVPYLERKPGDLYRYTRPTWLPEAALTPEAPGTCPAESLSYPCAAETQRTGESQP